MALTQAQRDSLMKALGPHFDTEQHRMEFGLRIYTALFKAKPNYVPMFSRLQGLDASNVMQSDGIKYYGRTLGNSLNEMFSAAANKTELDKLLDQSAKDHTSRNVTKEQLLGGAGLFIEVIGSLLTKAEDKQALEQFINYIFPRVAAYI